MGVDTALIAFGVLINKAFAKIIIMLLAVLMTFLALPQTRAAAMLGVAVLSSFAGGILVQSFQDERLWTEAFAYSVSFGFGFTVFPALMMFGKFYSLLSNDQALYNTIYSQVREVFLNRFTKAVDKV